jgi:alpha-glucosidase
MRASVRACVCGLIAGLGGVARAPAPTGPVRIASPDGHLVATVSATGQAPSATWRYRLESIDNARTTELLAWSPLGISRADDDFGTLRLTGVSAAKSVSGAYHLPHGKQRDVVWTATERTLHFESAAGHPLDLVLRVADDGLAFRYRFPDASADRHTVTGESTGFAIPKGAHAWMLPHQEAGKWAPAYEDMFQAVDAGTPSPSPAGWSYPALFELPSGHWLLLTEAGLEPGYCGTRLATEAPLGTYRVRFPDAAEGLGTGQVDPVSTLPWRTPWRLVMAGQSLATIVESTLVTTLAAPTTLTDTSWIQPGRSSFGWWKDDDASTREDVLDRFIDLSASMHWEYSLIDANWQRLPDGALERVIDHARQQHVGIFLWYNSGGPHNDVTEWGPRDRLFDPDTRRAEFARIAALGVKGVKVDFWQSDKQNLIQLYYDMMRDAAAAHLLIDFHGCTIPRGWSRTWPNLVSMEAVFGAEQYKYQARMGEQGAWHNTILVFTRNAIGPMDYTPVTLSDAKFPHQTTNAHEIALSVAFESGVTHFADGPDAYGDLPDAARDYLRDVPPAWDETRLLDGEPGRLAVVARRSGADWWVAAISGRTTPQTLPLDLSFLGQDDREWDAIIVRDGALPRQMVTESATVRPQDRFTIPLLARGGCALRFRRR